MERMRRLAGISKIFSDLNLNGDAPVRVQPKLGEWQPLRVPVTAEKKKARFTVTVATISVAVALFWLGDMFYKMLMGG